MKKNILNLRTFALVLLTALMLSACSKDDAASDNIIGTWTIQSSSLEAMVGDKSLTQYFVDVMQLPEAEALQYSALFQLALQQTFVGTIQIKSDGTYVDTMGGQTDTGTWSLSSDGKKLTIDPSTDDPITLDIVELTSTLLKVNLTESESEDLNDDGTPETISLSVDLTFYK